MEIENGTGPNCLDLLDQRENPPLNFEGQFARGTGEGDAICPYGCLCEVILKFEKDLADPLCMSLSFHFIMSSLNAELTSSLFAELEFTLIIFLSQLCKLLLSLCTVRKMT